MFKNDKMKNLYLLPTGKEIMKANAGKPEIIIQQPQQTEKE